jgi:anti-anti-sigma regulatory factor
MASGFAPEHGRLPNSPPGAVSCFSRTFSRSHARSSRARVGWLVAAQGKVLDGRFERGSRPPQEATVLDVGPPDRSGERVSIALRGSLADADAARLRHSVVKHYVDDGVREIYLDASELAFVDEDGVGALLRLRAEALLRSKRLWLVNPRGQVRDKLSLINVPDLLTANEDDAGRGDRGRFG